MLEMLLMKDMVEMLKEWEQNLREIKCKDLGIKWLELGINFWMIN